MSKDFIGLGVAGNFTQHLEQAGEAGDFVGIEVEAAEAPKGIFPWYVPGSKTFLGVNPLSSSTLSIPKGTDVQAEPELMLICDVQYNGDKVVGLKPVSFGAFNDASLRVDKPKISLKKNWGLKTKGMSTVTLPVDSFSSKGVLNDFVLWSWLKRDGQWHQYGEMSEVRFYSYFYQQLLDWLVRKLNTQEEQGPLENIAELLKSASRPAQAYIAVGSTRYTYFGETEYLKDGDEIAIVLFDEQLPVDRIVSGLEDGTIEDSCICLRQRVEVVSD